MNECGCDMEDDERPNPREEQNKRETKKHKSHKRLPICHGITGARSFGRSYEAVSRGFTSQVPEQAGLRLKSCRHTAEAEGTARPQRARPLYSSICGLLHIMCALWMQRRSCELDTSACTEFWRGTAC